MSQITLGGLTTLNLATHLDAMFTELYGYTAGARGATGNFVVGSASEIGISDDRLQVVAGPGRCVLQNSNVAKGAAFIWSTTTSGDCIFAQFATEAGATIRGSIDFNRGGTAVRYNTTSDRRLKRNIAAAPSAGALIDALQVRQFDWAESGEHTNYGFVAQELAAHYPEAVRQGDAGETLTPTSDVWAADFSTLVPALVLEIQSLRARLAAAGIA